jgi:hypothetical protein
VLPTLATALLLGILPPATPPPRIRIDLVFNGVPMTAPLQAAAMREVTLIWSAYGVDVHASRPGEARRNGAIRLTVMLTDRPDSRPRNGTLGWIRFNDDVPEPAIIMDANAIATLVSDSALAGNGEPEWLPMLTDFTVGRVLGRALAHEIGHYLLRSRDHSRTGLMRAKLRAHDLTGQDRQSFVLSADQVTRLDSALAALSADARLQEATPIVGRFDPTAFDEPDDDWTRGQAGSW